MKANIFNFNRLGLLFKRFFAERFRTELIYWGIMAIIFMFIRNLLPLMAMLIIIGGLFYASRFFKEIHTPGSGVAYFMIPATQLEKLIVGIVMTSFYYFAMMIITYAIGNLLGTFCNNILASMNKMIIGINIFHESTLQWKLFNEGFGNGIFPNFFNFLLIAFLTGQSVYLLGSIYFSRIQFLATFFSLQIIQFLLSIVLIITIKLVLGTFNFNISSDDLNLYNFGKIIGSIIKIVIWFIPPFFWLVSYFRLTEKEI